MPNNSDKAYRILGIDPGLNITGYGVLEFGRGGPSVVEAGAIRTNAKGGIAERIQQLHADLTEIVDELRPDYAAMEKLYAHYKHPRTSILMAHARGVLMLACEQAGVAVRELAATEVKQHVTGNGHASKLQVQRAIQAVLKLSDLPQPPDVADTLAIALCAGRKH